MDPSRGDLRLAAATRPAAGDRIVEALRDVLTVEIFEALGARAVAPATVTALCEHLGAERSDVEQRLEHLVHCDLVEPSSGGGDAGERTYRPTRGGLITDEQWAQVSPAQQRRYTALLLELFDEHIWAAFDRGGFDDVDTHISRLPTDLDRLGYEEMVRLGRETLERAQEIQADVANRRADGTSDGESIRTQLMLLFFQQGDGSRAVDRRDEDELIADLYEVVDDIADDAPSQKVSWRALAARGRDLTRLARRLSRIPRARGQDA